MLILEAIILGIVQGVTEFLPVSSSGHLVLTRYWLGFSEFELIFDVFVHLATLIAILFFFRHDILKLTISEIKILGVGILPAFAIGLIFKNQVESAFSSVGFVSIMLMLTGLMNLWLNNALNKFSDVNDQLVVESKDIKWQQALVVGLFQAFAILPGISRSGWTVAGGILSKLDRHQAFRVSFLLLIPVIIGASGLQAMELIVNNNFEINWFVMMAGGFAALVSGVLSLNLFSYVIREAKLQWFGWYCLSLGILTLISNGLS